MAVFRVEKNHNYTTMANYHLRDMNLSLKAIGLLSKMLSLNDKWDYTTRGLASICKEGVEAIGSALKELEKYGYLVRHQTRDQRGRIADTEYIIYEKPHPPKPDTSPPDTSQPDTGKPYVDEPYTEKSPQLNTKQSKPNTSSTDISNPYQSNPEDSSRMGLEWMGCESTDDVRDLVYQNLEYHHLKVHSPLGDDSRLDEIAELIIEVLCSTKEIITVAGEDYPAPMVKERFLQISSSHIEYVIECLNRNTTYVRNIKRYLLATLFNAPSTIDSYYAAQVNHDLYHPNN